MYNVRKINKIMTSPAAMLEKFQILSLEYGPDHVKTRVCRSIVTAVLDELRVYCRHTHRFFTDCYHLACEVDLSTRIPKVCFYPYDYSHAGAYVIEDGIDTGYRKSLEDEKDA